MSELEFIGGRKLPTDFTHVDKYPARLGSSVESVEKFLPYSDAWRKFYNQNGYNACVGFGESQAVSIIDRYSFMALWLYREALKIDEWPGEADEGTSLRAGFDVLRTQGHIRHHKLLPDVPELKYGIEANHWATSVDEIRTAISKGIPVVMGTNWYSRFSKQYLQETRNGAIKEYRVVPGANNSYGFNMGGHCWTIIAASDKRQSFQTPNSWGMSYPRTWFSYELVHKLLTEYGEAGIIIPRL
jgi:hypothetical protein